MVGAAAAGLAMATQPSRLPDGVSLIQCGCWSSGHSAPPPALFPDIVRGRPGGQQRSRPEVAFIPWGTGCGHLWRELSWAAGLDTWVGGSTASRPTPASASSARWPPPSPGPRKPPLVLGGVGKAGKVKALPPSSSAWVLPRSTASQRSVCAHSVCPSSHVWTKLALQPGAGGAGCAPHLPTRPQPACVLCV